MAKRTYQEIILALEQYWAGYGCVLLTPYHTEVAAGTMNPATFLRSLGPKPWKTAYLEPVIRPLDGRYGENPMRFQHYFQYQVILKPQPADVLELYLESLRAIGLDTDEHDIRFVEDDWEQPTVGAWGLGWEVWCDGMEITQFTYFQQLGGLELDRDPGRDHLRPRPDRDGRAGEADRLRARMGRRDHLGGRLPRERARSGRTTTSRRPTSRCTRGTSTTTRRSASG